MYSNSKQQNDKIINTVISCRDVIIAAFRTMSNHIDESLDEIDLLLSKLEYQQEFAYRLSEIEYKISTGRNVADKSNRQNQENSFKSHNPDKRSPPPPKPQPKRSQPPPPPQNTKTQNQTTKNPQITKQPIQSQKQQIQQQPNKTNTKIDPKPVTKLQPKTEPKQKEKPNIQPKQDLQPILTDEDRQRIQRLQKLVEGQMTVSKEIRNFVVPSTFSSIDFYQKATKYLQEN